MKSCAGLFQSKYRSDCFTVATSAKAFIYKVLVPLLFCNNAASSCLKNNFKSFIYWNEASPEFPILSLYLAEGCMGPFKQYVTGLPPIFDPLPLVTCCQRLFWLPPLVDTEIVTNFELIMSRTLMQILNLIFAKMIFYSNFVMQMESYIK